MLVGHALLPQPLKKFRSRDAVFEGTDGAPELAFPPNGARIETVSGDIAVKVRDGIAPFTWLANGRPVLTKSYERSNVLTLSETGFVTLSVIDAEGRADRSEVRID